MSELPTIYIIRGVYKTGPKQMRGTTCTVSHWTRYKRHDAVMREATAAHPWMRVQQAEKYTGVTYGGIPLQDLREAMAKHLI